MSSLHGTLLDNDCVCVRPQLARSVLSSASPVSVLGAGRCGHTVWCKLDWSRDNPAASHWSTAAAPATATNVFPFRCCLSMKLRSPQVSTESVRTAWPRRQHLSLLSFMKFGLCVLGYRQGGPAGLRPDGWRTVKLCHVAPGCCRCWWWWRDAKLGLNIHNNSTGARTRCCGAVVLDTTTPIHVCCVVCIVTVALQLPHIYIFPAGRVL